MGRQTHAYADTYLKSVSFDDDGLTLFPWFHNVKIVKGIQIFTIFLQYLYNKSRYPLSNLRLYYFRTSAN